MFFETFDTTQVGQTLFCVLKELKTPKPVCFWDVRTRNNLFFKFLKIAIIRIFDIIQFSIFSPSSMHPELKIMKSRMFFETLDTTQVGQTLFSVLKELKTL